MRNNNSNNDNKQAIERHVPSYRGAGESQSGGIKTAEMS